MAYGLTVTDDSRVDEYAREVVAALQITESVRLGHQPGRLRADSGVGPQPADLGVVGLRVRPQGWT